ncbi:MAG: hypothetical protein JXD22_09690 [Sedimentisphaerales bacterium]|nr:hypothetical protein [Sedimentisphaerales bacterium]
MFKKLSPTARDVLKLAESIARQQQDDYIDTEHLLLAMAQHNRGMARQILLDCDITGDKIKAELEKMRPIKQVRDIVTGNLSASPLLKEVITDAIEMAEKFDNKNVCTEFLLFGLTRRDQTLSGRIIAQLGLTEEMVREKIAQGT